MRHTVMERVRAALIPGDREGDCQPEPEATDTAARLVRTIEGLDEAPRSCILGMARLTALPP